MFDNLEVDAMSVEQLQRDRIRCYILVEVGQKLGPRFEDISLGTKTLVNSEERLVEMGVALDPLPSDYVLDVICAIIEIYLDGQDELFGTFDNAEVES